MFYAKSTGGFYTTEIHGSDIPSDAVEITKDEHATLLEGQSSGKRIVADAAGFPILADQPKPTAAQVWDAIKAERDRRKTGGVKIGAKWFHSDDGSRIQQMGLVMMGAGLPAGLQWKTMDGTFITMTPALAQQVFTGQAASDQTIFAVAEGHRVAMEASADPATYEYSTGWPKIFGE
jgi:hypothetical protein